jgi:hypothetical protein
MRNSSLLFLFVLTLLPACSTGILRLPASIRAHYDPGKVRLLKEAAKHGVLFQFDDEVLKDVPGIQVSDNCRSTDDDAWGEQFFDILKIFDRNPNLYKKIHVIYLKKDDKPGFETNNEKDQVKWQQGRYLTISYQKITSQETLDPKIHTQCESQGLPNEKVTVTKTVWPSGDDIKAYLEKQNDKPKISRFEFDTGFMVYLANNMTIVRLNSAWAWEKSLKGVEVLPEVMNRLSDQVKTNGYDYVRYWLEQIDQNSRLGKQLKFFSVLQDQKLARGIGLDGTSARVLATVNQQSASTYLYVSYRSRGGEYEYSTMDQLNDCLKRFDPSTSSYYWKAPERYLHPGYSCDQE